MSTVFVVGLFAAVLLVVFVARALLGRASQERGTSRSSDGASPPQSDGSTDEASAGPSAQALRIRQAQERIASMAFDPSIPRQLRTRYPHLSASQTELVLDALRQWFELCALVELAPLTMPSEAVDEAWHAFICSTENYRAFCAAVFGRYLDHQPPDARSGAPAMPDRDARTWVAACAVEGINPASPDRLPLIYALDAEVAIPGRTSVDPAAMAALIASSPTVSGSTPSAVPSKGGAHLAGMALAPTSMQPGMDGRPAPADTAGGHDAGGLDWMTSWLLWRSLLEAAPAASQVPNAWQRSEADAAPWNDPSGSESSGSDRGDRALERPHQLPDNPVVPDADTTSAGCGVPPDDSDSDSGDSGSACSGGGDGD